MEILERSKKEKASKYVKRVLYQNISTMQLLPGTRLEEAELCEKLGMSRTPIREAILELAQIKMVDIHPQKGIFISLLDKSIIEQGQFLRMMLEPRLAELACDVKDEEFLRKEQECIVLLDYYRDKGPDIFRALVLDNEFHRRFYTINGKDFLYEMMRNMTTHLDRMRRLCMMSHDLKTTIDDHQAVLKAVAENKPVIARATMEDHLKGTLRDMKQVETEYPQYFR